MEETAVKPQKSWLRVVYEWMEAITIALVVVALIFAFVFRLVSVDGTSMLNTLHHGEQLVLSRWPYTPAYEDIVVLTQEGYEKPLIKRVIGLPGDVIDIDENGAVYRNGTVLDEPYVDVPTARESMDEAVKVPDGYVFVMGDNRARSCSVDSRTFGCVSQENLLGKAVFRISPLNQFGGLYD